jgi:fatty acid desaturase
VFALFIGFWLQSLSNFGHEAAHYNLARSRRLNDRAADWLVWPLFSQTVKNYRKLHWEHHRHLGDQQDTETSYHNCLSPWFLLKTLSGVYLLQSLLRYTRTNRRLKAGEAAPDAPGAAKSAGSQFGLLRTALLHAAILALLVWWGFWATACVWVLSVAVTFPCFATLRQVLEHRRLDASCDQDFKQIAHSPVNRMFGTGWFASSFGTAGFNRHLLHHWDPGVSYTRFDEMEAFLLRTALAPQIDAARSGYFHTLSQLIGKGWRDVR